MEKQEITEILLDKGFVFAPIFGRDVILTVKNFENCSVYADVIKRTPIELAQGLKDKFDVYLKDKNGKLISSVNGRNLDEIEEVIEEFIGRAETIFPTKENEPTPEPVPVEPSKKLNTKTIYFDYNSTTIPVEISYYGALKSNTPLTLNITYQYGDDEPYDAEASYFWTDDNYDEDSDDSFELVSTPEVGTELVKDNLVSVTFNGLN